MFGNFFGQQQDPAVMAEAYGVPPEIYQQLMGDRKAAVLGQLGGTLLAASQPGQIGDRGRILASGLQGIGDHGNRFNTNLLNASQMRLYADNLREKQEERKRREELREAFGKREDLSEDQRRAAMADPFGYLQRETQMQFALEQKDRAARAEIDRTVEMYRQGGVPEEVGLGLAVGRFKVQNDAMGRPRLVDVAQMAMQALQGGGQGAQGERVPQTQSTMPLTNARGQPIDYSSPFTVFGTARRIGNALTDAFGGNPPSPDQRIAEEALNALANRTVVHMQAEVPGRPTNYTRELWESRVVRADRDVGPDRAKTRLEQTRADIAREVERMTQMLPNVDRLVDYANMTSNLAQLTSLLSDYDAVLSSFGQPSQSQQRAQEGAIGQAIREYDPQTGRLR